MRINNSYIEHIQPENVIPNFHNLYPLPDGKDVVVDAIRQRSLSILLIQNEVLRQRFLAYMDGCSGDPYAVLPDELAEVYELYNQLHGSTPITKPIEAKMVHIFGSLFDDYVAQARNNGINVPLEETYNL